MPDDLSGPSAAASPTGRAALAVAVEIAAARAAASGRDGAMAKQFVTLFWSHVPDSEVEKRSAEALADVAMALWEFATDRVPGRPTLAVDVGCTPPVVRVVNDDMPFLVDSTIAALNGLGLTVRQLIHPIVTVHREAARLVSLGDHPLAFRESMMHIELDRLPADRADKVAGRLAEVLSDVRAVVLDWPELRGAALRLAAGITSGAAPVPMAEAAEASAFLQWLADDNFVFLGLRDYCFAETEIDVVAGSGRGLLRDDNYRVLDGLREIVRSSPEIQAFLRSPRLTTIAKSSRRSPVHRPALMDTIGIKTFDTDGRPSGIRLIAGLFTSESYTSSPRTIPILRHKLKRCLEWAGFQPGSHDARALQHILDALPRDDLFQSDERALFDLALGVLYLQHRQRVALFTLQDPFERGITCLVFVPRERYGADVQRRMAAILERAFDGRLDADEVRLDDSALARVRFLIATRPGQVGQPDRAALEQELVQASRTWRDRLEEALIAAGGAALLSRYVEAFPAGYVETGSPGDAIDDIAAAERCLAGESLVTRLTMGAEPGTLHLRTIREAAPLPLSDILPVLEDFGLRVLGESPHELRPRDAAQPLWLQIFDLAWDGPELKLEGAAPRFAEAFGAAWAGTLESDGFNRLVLRAGLTARGATVLRACCKVLRQAGSGFSQAYMEDTAAAHPGIARNLVELFAVSFDPAFAGDREAARDRLREDILADFDAVSVLDEDRILHSFLDLIWSALRTNHYRAGRSNLAIKFASRELDLIPKPKPWVEVYVYSPRAEGCHLRGGRVARGGIRWSDRKEDFRTEILGLMKAQMVKNAVIVPVGSKGGFVVKRPPASRDALMQEVVACYRTLISGLLDLTDSVRGNTVVPPPDVVRRDGDDPYLVVAADKGTATFSDIANGIAAEYGFWLGDAFASGGSVGYDHKVMGITARGAWEAVKRHFREIGRDIQTQPFTCVGVGDMSGDVFGNGMLLSRQTRLLAAFNHQHIFIDPNPEAAASFGERQRMFALPRSTWADYDRDLISAGGGVWERAAKSIPISPEARAALDIQAEHLPPAQLIQTLLRAPVDLLWFGGIGTYVKAATETNADAGDRANDALRVDATTLQAKVVGEGANLALTQRGRIEYALAGGRLNTDAIDNSAGVSTSDHEVNIKIAVNAFVASGVLPADQRAAFLGAMTDEVAELVLRDNVLQPLALSLDEADAPALLDRHVRLMRALERAGRLDRRIEFLPDEEALAERAAARRGLTRPELAVLLATAKMELDPELVASDVPDAPEMEQRLVAYFPPHMRTVSPRDLAAHRLRREIVATSIANEVVNRMGPGFVVDLAAASGRPSVDAARAFLVVRDALDLVSIWDAAEAADDAARAPVMIRLLLAVRTLAERAMRRLLQPGAPDVARLREGVAVLSAGLDRGDLLPLEAARALAVRVEAWRADGVPDALAQRVARLDTLAAAVDIARVGNDAAGARAFLGAGETLGLDMLRARAASVPAATRWQRGALETEVEELLDLQCAVATRVTQAASDLGTWMAGRADAWARLQETLTQVRAAPRPDLAMLVVASRQVRALLA
ncbi:MAG TPA: NAD-glutamate dehydrogenase [Acidisphaera sp.]|nr:NAD-glutamate dehydrogenase [Acidisphaera sp.]HME27730.1 NAD-glutamate dehydrogenase [Acetobacteraceae bacterium]